MQKFIAKIIHFIEISILKCRIHIKMFFYTAINYRCNYPFFLHCPHYNMVT